MQVVIHGEKTSPKKQNTVNNIIYNSIPYGLPGEKDQVKKTEPSLFATGIYDRRARESKSDPERIPDGLSGKRKTFRTQVYKRPF